MIAVAVTDQGEDRAEQDKDDARSLEQSGHPARIEKTSDYGKFKRTLTKNLR